MTIDPSSGRVAFPEIGLTVEPSLTRSRFLRLPLGAVALARVRHDPSFRYQLPVMPQADSQLYVMLQFYDERLASVNLFHHAERFDHPPAGWSETSELARQNFQENWLTTTCGANCQRYRWGEVFSRYDPVGRSSSIVIEFARKNAWQVAGRTAGMVWGAVRSR